MSENTWSDMLVATGWLNDHPSSGGDLAHLLLYPTTDFDPDTRQKVGVLATKWRMVPLAGPNMSYTDVQVDLPTNQLVLFGQPLFNPMNNLTPEWKAAARRQGLVILTITGNTLSAPTLDILEQTLQARPDHTYCGIAVLTTGSMM